MKAFLSHSSKDKEFVRSIAKELGRQYCVFDEQVFATGDEFKKSIEQGLDDSAVFVLFASQASLESIWVKFETDEAWYRKLKNGVSKGLVYVIDSKVDIENIPEWLKRALIRRDNVPKKIARDIRFHIDDLLREKFQSYFMGRDHDMSELEKLLTPFDTLPPHVAFIHGLPGIGRRSLIKQKSPQLLNLKKFVEIPIGEGDSIQDISISVANHAEPYSTTAAFASIASDIKLLTPEKALSRTVNNLRSLVDAGELPILTDEGGLLDNDGFIQEPIKRLISNLTPTDDTYIFFISSRKPQQLDDLSIPALYLKPLSLDDTKRLVARLAMRAGVTIAPDQISEIAEFVGGYPPAAFFSIQQVKDYGLDSILHYKERLAKFKLSVFIRHIAGIKLDDDEKKLLKILAAYSPLPLQVIGETLQLDSTRLSKLITHLIDLALLIVTEDHYYRLADPLIEVINSQYGYPTEEDCKVLATSLAGYINQSDLQMPILALSRVLFRAARWARDIELSDKAIHISNDLIRLTENSYHAGQYKDTIKYAGAALDERPNSITARNFLIRALIHEERWRQAEEEIKRFEKVAGYRDILFLKGFLERKRQNIPAAIDFYEKAEKAGRRGVAIKRELGHCYYLNKNPDKAMAYIADAVDQHGDNIYIVDLWTQIAISKKDEVLITKALNRLEILDAGRYNYRLSRYKYSQGQFPDALSAAKRAVELSARMRFEVQAQLVYCDIELKHYDDAEKLLNIIDKSYQDTRADIRIALRCRLEIARGRFARALDLCDRVTNKDSFYYKKIRHDALVGEVKTSALKDSVRQEYMREIAVLEGEVRDAQIEDIAPIYD